MKKVLVFGSTGMLGREVMWNLISAGFEVFETNRSGLNSSPESTAIAFDIVKDPISSLKIELGSFDFIINCAGLIKQKMEDTGEGVKNAIRLNSLFPVELVEYAEKTNTKVFQIATDCVFSGKAGLYSETSERDPIDAYGYSKALGETASKNLITLRCSIIGRETLGQSSLLEWFLKQSKNAEILGYTNHNWNGVTTFHFAKLLSGVMQNGTFVPGTWHVVPTGYVNKFELLRIFSKNFGREDISILPVNTDSKVNRTLITIFPEINEGLWKNAGYFAPLTHAEMLSEYAESLSSRSH
jgi:dTDP-4-dehydrorhamnose reductase